MTSWYLHEDRHTFILIYRSNFLTMNNAKDKICRKNQNRRFTFHTSDPKITTFMI